MEGDKFRSALTAQSPTWHIDYATQQELQQFAHSLLGWTAKANMHEVVDDAHNQLRKSVSLRLVMPIRATLHAGLLTVS